MVNNIFTSYLYNPRVLGAALPGAVEPTKSSLWMDLFSLDSVIGYSNLQLFAIFMFEVDFSETSLMTIAENSVLWGRIPEDTPRPPYKGSAFGTRDNALLSR